MEYLNRRYAEWEGKFSEEPGTQRRLKCGKETCIKIETCPHLKVVDRVRKHVCSSMTFRKKGKKERREEGKQKGREEEKEKMKKGQY